MKSGFVGVDRQRNLDTLEGSSDLNHRIEVRELAGRGDLAGDIHRSSTLNLFFKGQLHTVSFRNFALMDGKVRVIIHDRLHQRSRDLWPCARASFTHVKPPSENRRTIRNLEPGTKQNHRHRSGRVHIRRSRTPRPDRHDEHPHSESLRFHQNRK